MGKKERIKFYKFRVGLAETDVKQKEEGLKEAQKYLAREKDLLEQAEKE